MPSGFAEADGDSAVESNGGGDGRGVVTSLELSGAARLSGFGSASASASVVAPLAVAAPSGVAATTASSPAKEVSGGGDFTGLGMVTADSLDPPGAGLAGAASVGFSSAAAASAGFASAGFASTGASSAGFSSTGDEDLPVPPLPRPGDGSFGLVVREAARRAGVAGGGVAPETDGLPEAEESDRVFSPCREVSADFDEEPSASAAVRLEDLSWPSGVSPFLLVDSGLGSTVFRTTVSG